MVAPRRELDISAKNRGQPRADLMGQFLSWKPTASSTQPNSSKQPSPVVAAANSQKVREVTWPRLHMMS